MIIELSNKRQYLKKNMFFFKPVQLKNLIVLYNIVYFITFAFFSDKVVELVRGGSVINVAYPV